MLRTETSRAASMGQFPKTEHSVSRHDEYAGRDLTTVRRPRDERKSSPMGLQRLQTAANERAAGTGTITAEDIAMANESRITSEFQRGWDAALRAARNWHETRQTRR
jgi:hypothetical protein